MNSIVGGFELVLPIAILFYQGDQSLSLEVFIVNLGLSPSAPTSVEQYHNLFHNLNKWD